MIDYLLDAVATTITAWQAGYFTIDQYAIQQYTLGWALEKVNIK